MTYLFHTDPRNAGQEQDELTIQVSFRRKMRELAPTVKLVAIPNAGRRSSWEQIKRAKEGLISGFPDLMALHQGRVAFLEFKSGIGSIDVKQVDQMNWLHRNAFPVGAFRSVDTAVEWMREHMPDAFTGALAA